MDLSCLERESDGETHYTLSMCFSILSLFLRLGTFLFCRFRHFLFTILLIIRNPLRELLLENADLGSIERENRLEEKKRP